MGVHINMKIDIGNVSIHRDLYWNMNNSIFKFRDILVVFRLYQKDLKGILGEDSMFEYRGRNLFIERMYDTQKK